MTLPRALISSDYGGRDIKDDWRSGGSKSLSGVPRAEPEAFFVKLHIIFALKYNEQQLLLLLDKINLAAKYKNSTILEGTCPPSSIGINVPGHIITPSHQLSWTDLIVLNWEQMWSGSFNKHYSTLIKYVLHLSEARKTSSNLKLLNMH